MNIINNLLFSFVLVFSLFARAEVDPQSAILPSPEFEKNFKALMAAGKVPGAAISIYSADQVYYQKGFGFKDLANQKPVTPNTLFAIGSTSKAFTATAIMMLVEEGKLDLDKPIIDYYPEFRLYDDVATLKATPRDLLNQVTGVPRHDLGWYLNPTETREELVERVRYQEPNKTFRQGFDYNNNMFVIAGMIVEKLTGKSWEEFVQERILDPLSMKETNFSVDDMQKAADYALPYGFDESKNLVRREFRNLDVAGPAGSINSNLVEHTKWMQLQLSGGKVGNTALIKPESLHELHKPRVLTNFNLESFFPDVMSDTLYAMGWTVNHYRGKKWIWHGGGIDGFLTMVGFFPELGVGYVMYINSDSGPILFLNNLLLDEILAAKGGNWQARYEERQKEKDKVVAQRKSTTEPTPTDLKNYFGEYFHPGYGSITVAATDDKTALDQVLVKFKVQDFVCKHYKNNVFYTNFMGQEFNFRFVPDWDGNVTYLEAVLEPTMGPKHSVRFERVVEAD